MGTAKALTTFLVLRLFVLAADLITAGHGDKIITTGREVSKPELTFRCNKQEEIMRKVEKILVPIDFTEESARALKRATGLATENGAELIALHVVDARSLRDYFLSSLAAPEDPPFMSEAAPTHFTRSVASRKSSRSLEFRQSKRSRNPSSQS